MSTISAYTTVTNAIKFDYCFIEAIKSALLFADEVVIVDGGSTDGTIEAIKGINDGRIKIFNIEWLDTIGTGMYGISRSMAIGHCTSDWSVLFDADEVFCEDDVERIKKIPQSVESNIIAVKFNTIHFYKDYNHVLNGFSGWKDLYTDKIYMVRNGLGIHHGNINGDPDNFLLSNGKPIPEESTILTKVKVFHYGYVREEGALKAKLEKMHGYWEGKKVEYDKVDWLQVERLGYYRGLHPKVMEKRIEEFICKK